VSRVSHAEEVCTSAHLVAGAAPREARQTHESAWFCARYRRRRDRPDGVATIQAVAGAV